MRWLRLAIHQKSTFRSFREETHPRAAPRVNAASLDCNTLLSYDYSIFWFGKVTPSENYADVRLGYNNSELCVYISIFDRLTWYDDTPLAADLTNWDAVTLLLDRDGNVGNVPDSHSFLFTGQLRWWEDPAKLSGRLSGLWKRVERRPCAICNRILRG